MLDVVDPIAIIQIDSTIIAGILILLTITKLAKSIDENMPCSVLVVVIPFSLSAIFSLVSLLGYWYDLIVALSVFSTIAGFIFVMFAIYDLRNLTYTKH